jgi:hypothetical protein
MTTQLTSVTSAEVADAHRDDGKRFIVHADELLTAFMELEAALILSVLQKGSAGRPLLPALRYEQ